jgi:hypothetical protein
MSKAKLVSPPPTKKRSGALGSGSEASSEKNVSQAEEALISRFADRMADEATKNGEWSGDPKNPVFEVLPLEHGIRNYEFDEILRHLKLTSTANIPFSFSHVGAHRYARLCLQTLGHWKNEGGPEGEAEARRTEQNITTISNNINIAKSTINKLVDQLQDEDIRKYVAIATMYFDQYDGLSPEVNFTISELLKAEELLQAEKVLSDLQDTIEFSLRMLRLPPPRRGRPIIDYWKWDFLSIVTDMWEQLTGRPPPDREDGPFIELVESIWLEIDPGSEPHWYKTLRSLLRNHKAYRKKIAQRQAALIRGARPE